VEYPHVVFTLPAVLPPRFLGPPKTGSRLRFAAVAEPLREVALRPKNLGARIGFSAVLPTWTQTLRSHPPIPGIVTGGGLSADGTRWVPARPGFLFPVRILARVFRGKLLRQLAQALAAGPLRISEADPAALRRQAARPGWVVDSKPPFAGPEHVLRSLARSTHRLAGSTERRVGMHTGQVPFPWTDRAPGDQRQRMPLAAAAFLRRFLRPVLPAGLVRIRHDGLLANGAKQTLLPRWRELLGVGPADEGRARDPAPWAALVARLTGRDPPRCPVCRTGHLIAIAIVPPRGPLSGERTTARAP
jgi:hypothetical protein